VVVDPFQVDNVPYSAQYCIHASCCMNGQKSLKDENFDMGDECDDEEEGRDNDDEEGHDNKEDEGEDDGDGGEDGSYKVVGDNSVDY